MDEIKFTYKANITEKQLKEVQEKLIPEIDKILAAQKNNYQTDYGSINLSNDQKYLQSIKYLVEKKEKLKPKVIVIAGIGGSSLGTQAIYNALKSETSLKCIFADTIEADYTNEICKEIENILQEKNEIILAIISKSGTTTETLVNASLILDLLKKHRPQNYKDFIVAITDTGSHLENIAKENNIDVLTIPKLVGGRYSVFSAVGLFPLALLNINIEKLIKGAQEGIKHATEKNLSKNLAALSAAIIYLEYKNSSSNLRKNIHDTYIFNPKLTTVGLWYRQLMGESLGRQEDLQGKPVSVGITPTVSVGTNDLHSVTQLYLAGPSDKMTTFLHVHSPAHGLKTVVSGTPEFLKNDEITIKENLVSQINPSLVGRSLNFIHEAIFQGTVLAYERKKRPYISITLPKLDEYFLGQFLQIKMIEMIYLGYLLNINPFIQPEVELYKQETRKILSS